ncbi:MAG: hypothetical protein N3D82_00405 [Ignisphaera sp.]|nr:hypothetical protein [Ignisphaera sp.]MCX8167477.1 hypothetical protein [Ignisphaera sp.]MDW8084659.1 hypothetical protein [Ignisphaera sp.]
MVRIVTFNRIGYKLPDLSLIDSMDVAIMRFIQEKFGGRAPLNELNVVTVMTALAPKWQESISIPLIKDMVPNGLLRALSSSFAEKELLSRIQKLEQLNLIKVDREVRSEQSFDEEQKIVSLTNIGREIAQYNGILLHGDSLDEAVDKLLQLSVPVPIQDVYTINPKEICIALPNETIEVEKGKTVSMKPVFHLAVFGVKFLNEVIIGPFSGIPKIIIMGGYAPITIRRGSQLGYIVHTS